MRRRYSRVADASHEALVEQQIVVTLSVLAHHHAEEDTWL